jgi:MazG family protein
MSLRVHNPAYEPDEETVRAFGTFVAIVRQLRRDCPWDREQTHESVRHLLVEETYETVEAIESGDRAELAKELGDLLLHVVFHSAMAEQEGTFDVRHVIERESEKLIRRHPHVFGDVMVNGSGAVVRNWEEIKMSEGGRTSSLDGVPAMLPSLLRAFRIQEKAAGVGFDFATPEDAFGKVEEEIGEFRAHADSAESQEEREKEFGDVLFALVNYARLAGINPENALRATNDKFVRRFRYIEDQLRKSGKSPSQSDLQEMDKLWDQAKTQEI